MAKVPYLFRRNNIFYFRTRIPLKLQKSLKAKEVVLSLKTENQAETVPLALIIAARFKTSLLDIQAGHKIIFPAWTPRNGKTSANASKWFKRYIESIGLRDETEGARLSGFHSLRNEKLISCALSRRFFVFLRSCSNGRIAGYVKLLHVGRRSKKQVRMVKLLIFHSLDIRSSLLA